MDHIIKTIETIETKISEHERAIIKLRSTINDLCSAADMPPKYQLEGESIAAPGGSKTLLAIKPDEFYGKPLATAVRNALNMLRDRGRAPASVEHIYDVLVQGGYDFETKSREANVHSLSISVGKNSALFAKLPNGLVGVKEWYGATTTRAKRKDGNGTAQTDDDQPSDQTDSAPSQGDEVKNGGAA